jgi:hypothetical protein
MYFGGTTEANGGEKHITRKVPALFFWDSVVDAGNDNYNPTGCYYNGKLSTDFIGTSHKNCCSKLFFSMKNNII